MKIYVGNIEWRTTEEELRKFFESYGEVNSVQILKDRESGKSRGFGFVEIRNNAQALNAIKELHGKELNGRGLKINEARKTFKKSYT